VAPENAPYIRYADFAKGEHVQNIWESGAEQN